MSAKKDRFSTVDFNTIAQAQASKVAESIDEKVAKSEKIEEPATEMVVENQSASSTSNNEKANVQPTKESTNQVETKEIIGLNQTNTVDLFNQVNNYSFDKILQIPNAREKKAQRSIRLSAEDDEFVTNLCEKLNIPRNTFYYAAIRKYVLEAKEYLDQQKN